MNLRTAISCVCSALVLLVGVQVVSAAPAPGVSWATNAGGTGSDEGNGISALPDGSSIVTGYFYDTATFGSTTLTSSAGGTDVFVAKMNADGTWAWATKAGGTGADIGYGISALPDGSSIVTGDFGGDATFGSTILRSAGCSALFTAKMNADGSWAWATQAGGTGDAYGAYGAGISALPDGSSVVTGRFSGATTFGSTTLTSAEDYDVFTAKMNADGTWAWATKAGGPGRDEGKGISVLPDGSSIVTGFFSDTATFGITALTSAGSYDVFTAKMNADGSWAWATKAGGTGLDSGLGISALPDGSSVVTGVFYSDAATFGSTTLTNAGSHEAFTAKMNADGSWAWATRAGGSGIDVGQGISALPDGSSIVTGYFSGTTTFGSTALTSAGSYDVFTAKMNADGTWAWATRAGGTGEDEGKGISALPDGSSVLSGDFSGTATFGSTTLTTAGGTCGTAPDTYPCTDVFTARYLDAPQAPAAPVAVAGNASAAVTITPLAGGSVTSYTVTSGPGEKTCTVVAPAISCTVEGLTNGTGYRFRATATNSAGTGAASAWSNAVTPAKKVPLLKSSLTCGKTGVRTTCTTRGPVPPGATAVTQRATTSAAPAAQSREMAKPKVKTAKGTCRITKRGKGKKATRTYQCTIRLSKGKWTITTKALTKTTAIAQSVKIKKVK